MEIRYLTDLNLTRHRYSTGAEFTLATEFRVSIDGVIYTVPANFKTDLASVPRLFRSAVSVVSAIEGSILHDFFYRIPGKIARAMADKILYQMARFQLRPKGKPTGLWGRIRRPFQIASAETTAAIMYGGVRAGGWFTWRQAR